MLFFDETKTPPPPPPPPVPAMPYWVELLTYGGLGATSVRPTKMYPDRGGDMLSPDEVGVWEYVKHLESALLAPPVGLAPALPYRVELMTYGGLGATSQRLTKLYPTWGGDVMTPDECAVWEYVQHLEAEVKRVTVERELSVLDSPFAPADAPESLTDINLRPAPASDPGEVLSKRQRAERALLDAPDESNVQIGKRAGISHETVRQVRAELQAAGKLQQPAAGG